MFEHIYSHIREAEAAQEDKHQFFIQRTNQHIDLVKAACDKLMKEYPEFKELKQRGLDHDASKFEEPELTPYIELTWNKKHSPDTKPTEEILKATLHHITSNSHHPEYHLKDKSQANISKEDRDKSVVAIDATAMPDIDVAEMVADWQAMSEELGTNTASEWFNKTKDVRWHFNEHQEDLINKLLAVFEGKKVEGKPKFATFDQLKSKEEPKPDVKPEAKPEHEIENESICPCGYIKLPIDPKSLENLINETHSREKCMECSSKPDVEILWAEGMGHAWFCNPHFKTWAAEHKGDIDYVKEVVDGKAASKFQNNKNPNIKDTLDFLKESVEK